MVWGRGGGRPEASDINDTTQAPEKAEKNPQPHKAGWEVVPVRNHPPGKQVHTTKKSNKSLVGEGIPKVDPSQATKIAGKP